MDVLVTLKSPIAAVVDLNSPGHYVHWGFIQLSLANLIVIVAMLAVFIVAILVPFRMHGSKRR